MIKFINTIKFKVKYFFYKFRFLLALFSPFKPFKAIFYFGEIKIGTPYFLPRKLVKNKENPGWMKFVPKKFGIDVVPLGWKTKWSDTDYRFEWSPRISIVFWKYQFCVSFVAPEESMYWECWLYYDRNTDKKKSKKERLIRCYKENPCVWTSWSNSEEQRIDYYLKIVKEKYIKYIQ